MIVTCRSSIYTSCYCRRYYLKLFFDYLVERIKQYITELRLVFKKNSAILKCNRYVCKYNKNGECYNMPVRVTVLGNCKVALNDEVMGYDGKNN